MIIRCRSKTGTARYTLEPSDNVAALLEKIYEDAPDADASTVTLSNNPKEGQTPAGQLQGTLSDLGIKHGDLLFIHYKDREVAHIASTSGIEQHPQTNGAAETTTTSTNSKAGAKKPWELVTEDAVDSYWEKQDGLIKRDKSRMCKHGEKSMCDHCMPLEPYDAVFQQENSIKHLSFHAHLRKLDIRTNSTTATSSNMFIPPLSKPDYRVKVPCPSGSHQSWPEGICTKCQPSAITLTLQQYRLVDHVEFASPDLIDRLLGFWRRTGMQRFGWLLGRYEVYDKVPMGVRAVVEAIHEPPQEGDSDGLRLGVPWEDEGKVESLAEMCGLKVVGMVYTDLTPDEDKEKAKIGKVQRKRHRDSYFLSSLEAVFGATQQTRRPNYSRFSDSGKYSSKFVTCVVTGNSSGDIGVEAYQISDQGMAMVEADMIEPSVDPAVVRVKDENLASTSTGAKRYIPDVFFSYKNEYKLQVKESAKPCFPTDYLLVSLTSGFPNEPSTLFKAPTNSAFAIENRPGLHDQSLNAVYPKVNALVKKLPASLDKEGFEMVSSSSVVKGKGKASDAEAYEELADWLSDWHLLAYLDTCGIFDRHDMKLLASVATKRDQESIRKLLKSMAWQTLVTIAQEHNVPAGNGKQDESSVPQFEFGPDGFPIIPADHDMMRTDTPDIKSGAATSGTGSEFADIPDLDMPPDTSMAGQSGGEDAPGMLVCPHCTFENAPGTIDCEICNLPLNG